MTSTCPQNRRAHAPAPVSPRASVDRITVRTDADFFFFCLELVPKIEETEFELKKCRQKLEDVESELKQLEILRDKKDANEELTEKELKTLTKLTKKEAALMDEKKALMDEKKALMKKEAALMKKEAALMDEKKALMDEKNLRLQLVLQSRSGQSALMFFFLFYSLIWLRSIALVYCVRCSGVWLIELACFLPCRVHV